MNTEYVIPIILNMRIKDTIVTMRVYVTKIEGQPYILLQLEPLMN